MSCAGPGRDDQAGKAGPEASGPGVAGARLDGSWPQWRGPSRDATAPDPGLDAWAGGDFEPRQIWRRRLGAGFSGLTVVPPQVFTTWVDGDSEVLGALDAATGEVGWILPLGDVKGSAHGDGPRSTPLHWRPGGEGTSPTVVAMGSFGDLVAVDATTGLERWRRDLRPLAEGDEPDWGFSASPLLYREADDPMLLVHLGGPASVLALDPSSGETLWQTESFRGYASPVVAELAGRDVVLSFTGFGLLGLDPASGAVLFERNWDTYYGLNAADPIPLPPDRVFLSANYNTGAALLRLSVADDGGTWSAEDLWTSRRMRNHYATSLVWPEAGLIVGFDGDFLTAIDVETGKLAWKARGVGRGQALRVEDSGGSARLLVLNDQCEVLLGSVDRQGWTEAARHQLDLDGTCYALPSLVGRRLFARDDRHAVAVDLAPDLAPGLAPPFPSET